MRGHRSALAVPAVDQHSNQPWLKLKLGVVPSDSPSVKSNEGRISIGEGAKAHLLKVMHEAGGSPLKVRNVGRVEYKKKKYKFQELPKRHGNKGTFF